MYPVLFTIGNIPLYSLSIFLILAWLVCSFVFWKLLRAEAVEEEHIFNLTFYSTLMALVLARCWFVFLHWSLFSDNWMKIAALWVAPGLSMYGGVVGGMVTAVVLARQYKVRVAHVLDAVAMALPIALIIGEIGSFLDGSSVGKETRLPWVVWYVGHAGSRHPVQLYAIAALIVILFLLSVVKRRAVRKKWPYGLLGICFFLLFALFFFGIEFFTEDSVYWVSVSANQWVLIGLFAESIGAFYVRGGGRDIVRPYMNRIKTRIRKVTGGIYAAISKRRTLKHS